MNQTEMLTQLAGLGYAVVDTPDDSAARFADGARYRVEIPSCEGPAVFAAVLEEADALGVRVHRVSQGSGVMMLSDDEIGQMVRLGSERDVEVNLFLGPRAAWDVGAQSRVTAAVGGSARGNAAVAACLVEARRACDLGIRSLLVGDLGVLTLVQRLKESGDLPGDLALKTSVVMPLTNGPTARLYQDCGATSLNVSTDLTVGQLAELRAASDVALDMYLESPDDQGGVVRFYEVADIVRAVSPIYLKFGVRNAPNIYPVGRHLAGVAADLGRERVRRAGLVLRLLEQLDPELAGQTTTGRAPDLAVPEP
jgi:peptidase U32-like protein